MEVAAFLREGIRQHNAAFFGIAKAGYNENEPRDERGQWAKLWASYPRLKEYPTEDKDRASPDQQLIWEHLGGHIKVNYDSGTFENSCAIRVSEALNQSGDPVPYTPGKTVSGATDVKGKKNWYFYRVNDLRDHLTSTRGKPDAYTPSEWKTSLAGKRELSCSRCIVGMMQQGIFRSSMARIWLTDR